MLDTLSISVDENYHPVHMSVGDIGHFRYIDADGHDPERKEIFFGIVIKIFWYDFDGKKMSEPTYDVMCTDEKIRKFAEWERWYVGFVWNK